MEGESCPRCQYGVLKVDDVEGFLLCEACGHVADEVQIVLPGEDGQAPPEGVLVDHEGRAFGEAS